MPISLMPCFLPEFHELRPRQQRPVDVRRTGWLEPKIEEQLTILESIRLTGMCGGFVAHVAADHTCISLRLQNWVPDRNGGTPIPLSCDGTTDWSEFMYLGAVRWLNAALRYYMTHEADEAIVLPDGTRPLDPHQPAARCRMPVLRRRTVHRGFYSL